MKHYYYLAITFFIFIPTFKLFGQKDSAHRHLDYWDDQKVINGQFKNEIDPRQYVRVLYKKNPNYKPIDRMEVQRIIWNWNDTGYFQKFKVLDNEGFLNIFFDKDELSKNYNFQGNVSLEANLKGKEGERKIEVGPYSLVGVERKAIGIESFPPTTVAQLLFNTILEMKRTIVSLDFQKYDSSFIYINSFLDDTAAFSIAKKDIERLAKENPKSKINISEAAIRIISSRIVGENYYYSNLKKMIDDPNNYTYEQLNREIQTSLDQIPYFISSIWSNTGVSNFKKDLTFLLNELTLINTYLSSFEKAGSDAVQAFLFLAAKDKINFTFLKTSLINQEEYLRSILKSVETSKNYRFLVTTPENLNTALQIIQNLRIFSSIEGSEIHKLIQEYVKDSVTMKNAYQIKSELEELNGSQVSKYNFSEYFESDSTSIISPNNFSRYIPFRLMEKSDSFNVFKQKLSIAAAKIIYKKLVFATIDLGKSGAQPGDILYINVVWKNIDGEKDSTDKFFSLPIGKYFLQETGWKTLITESFYLIERINEPSSDITSPSNFKGAGGASIMRTFYYNENYEKTFGGRFINWLQPSFGFNVSYLDFYTNKDIEIGAGLQLGLFKNVFFFGSGINLHSIRGEEKKSAAYFMFGVSFTNIAAKFKQGTTDTPSE